MTRLDLYDQARERRDARRIDISEPLRQIADLLGVDIKRVARVEIEPGEALVTVYEENENGKMHVNDLGYARLYQVHKDVWT